MQNKWISVHGFAVLGAFFFSFPPFLYAGYVFPQYTHGGICFCMFLKKLMAVIPAGLDPKHSFG